MKFYNYVLIFVILSGILSILIIRGVSTYREDNENSHTSKELANNLLKHTKGLYHGSILLPSFSNQEVNKTNLEFFFKKMGDIQLEEINPIILIPGLGGSKIYGKWEYTEEQKEFLEKEYGDCGKICRIKESSWNTMWISYESLAPNIFGAECWKYRILTNFKDNKFINTEGVQSTTWRKENYDKDGNLILTDDFGGVEGVNTLLSLDGYCPSAAYMFHNIIKILEKYGYKVKENLFGAPYDFRQILNDEYLDLYCKMLKDLIELSKKKNNGKPAIIFTHSLGGPIFSLFLNYYLPKIMPEDDVNIWKKNFIKLAIPVNAPFGGSPKALRTAISGDNEGLGLLCLTYGCNDWYWDIEKLVAGVLFMFPNEEIFGTSNLVKIDENEYNLDKVTEILDIAGNTDAKNAIQMISRYKKYLLKPLGIKTHIICGKYTQNYTRGGGTEMTFDYKITNPAQKTFQKQYENPNISGEVLFYQDLIDNGDFTSLQSEIRDNVSVDEMMGDGTVPFLSLRIPILWQKSGEDVTMHTLEGSKMDHKGILDQPKFWELLIELIK